jgi:hypothetical protein
MASDRALPPNKARHRSAARLRFWKSRKAAFGRLAVRFGR